MAIRTYLSGDLPTSNQYIKMRIECVLNSQDIAANASNVTVNLYFRRTNTGYTTHGNGTCYGKVDGTEYTQAVSNVQTIGYSTGNGVCLFSRSFTIAHGADGTKRVQLQGKAHLPNTSLSGEYQTYYVDLPTIPRASTCDAPNLVIGDDLTIQISRASTSFTHTLIFRFGVVERTIYNAGGSGTLPLSSAAASLYAALPNASSGKYTIVCQTHAGVNGALIGTYSTTGTVYVDAGRAAPTFTSFTFSATRSDLTGSNQKIIAGVSDLTVTIPVANRAVSNSGATIKKYIVTAGNKTAQAAWSASAPVSVTIGKPANGTISVAAVDSRGNQKVATKLATVTAYTPPSIAGMSVTRANSVDTDVTLAVTGAWWGGNFGAAANTLAMTYAYKSTTATTWSAETSLAPTTSGNQISLNAKINGDQGANGFTADASFDVRITVKDRLHALTVTRVLDRGVPTMHLTQQGVAVGKTMGTGLPAGSIEVAGAYYDKFGLSLDNGLAVYRNASSPYNDIDANTTLERLILTTKNAPKSSYHYIYTSFYSTKSTSMGRTQFAVPYTYNNASSTTPYGSLYHRVFSSNNQTWSPWRRIANADETRGIYNFVLSFSGTSATLDFTTQVNNVGLSNVGITAQIPHWATTDAASFYGSLRMSPSKTHTVIANASVSQSYGVYYTLIYDL